MAYAFKLKSRVVGTAVAALLVTASLALAGCGSDGATASQSGTLNGSEVEFSLANLDKSPQFFTYQTGGGKVGLLAVKDSTGATRVALDTCQVCNGSRKAYFVAEGQDVVCQNCGNHFGRTDVGVLSGGCNPAPIFTEERADTADSVRISYAFLSEHSALFTRWKENNA